MSEPWDEEKVYDEKISPLMTQIIALCKEHKIPMAATFQYCDKPEEGPGYCTTILPMGRAADRMNRVIGAMRPEGPVALAITEVTDPLTGRTDISVRRM